MDKANQNKAWNPYLTGMLAGLLAILSVLITTKVLNKGHYLGTSTTFVRITGLIEQQITPNHVAQNDYFQKTKIKIDWQMMLVAGIFVGSLISSTLGGQFKNELVPPIWQDRFKNKVALRAIGAFIGGIIAIIGVRMAGGCPSGHGMSGMMQLALSGLIAMGGFMAGGMITAKLIYNGGK